MAQSVATQHGGEPNPLDTTGLCLLSLDGGGVRGLSTLYILKGLMTRLNHERQNASLPCVKPCEVFDLIGGTSTGGLIAIMLGRLEMDVDACIAAYSTLMKTVFEERSSWLPVGWSGKVKARFDSAKLKSAIENVISKADASLADAFNDGKKRGCHTFVCATAKETAGITRLRSYMLPDEGEIPATICQAALATSAATGFFDPVSIGARHFVDGALGANNPVDEVEGEAANIWSPNTGDLKPLVKCFISIGTGHPSKKALEDNIGKFLSKSLVGIATETEETERKFIARWAKHYDEKRYFRFNVDQGLQEVGLAEYKEQGRIEAATGEYLQHQAQKFRVRDCIENLQQKQNRAEISFAIVINEFTERCIAQRFRSKNVHWIVPRLVNSLFTGRLELVDRIQSALRNNEPGTPKEKLLVITGIGGIGKSEVCLKVASLVREDFWGVFWVDVGSPSTAKNSFLAIAKALGSPAESVKESLQALANMPNRWLLILDNADNPAFDYAAYIPSGAQGAVIMTSRVPECSQYSTLPTEALEGLEEEDSIQLLLKTARVPQEAWQACREQAQAVVQLLRSHTLALIQAGAYIAEGYCQLNQYAGKYKQLRKRLLKHYPRQQQSRYQHIYATFEASISVLNDSEDEVGRDALDLLGVLSMLHSSVLPLDVFLGAWKGARDVIKTDEGQTAEIDDLRLWHVSQLPEFIDQQADEWDDYRLNRASALLVSLSLVTRHRLEDLNGLSMHSLAHAWAKDRLGQDQQQAAVLGITPLDPSRENVQIWDLAARNLGYLGDARQAVELLEHIVKVKETTLAETHPSRLASQHALAGAYDANGQLKEAVELLEHVVKMRETTLAETHPDRLASQHALAGAYRANGQTKEAVELLEHVVKVEETTLAETHPDRLASQHALAGAYRANGQTKEAVELLEHVVKMRETTLAETHPSRLASQHELAGAYRANGQLKEAVELLEHVVKMRETTLAETHPDRLASQHALAGAYDANGQLKEAVELLEHVVKVEETTLAETHPDRLASQHALAGAYWANGQTKEAVELLEHVVKVRETTLAETHPDRLASERALARMQSRKT
ncbi:kinase subdomain-containing protein [Bipolaris maydis]|nr:kinase subdomain-containing protein [Bipolaris maydis]